MSIKALTWAFDQKIKPSSLKFTLVALCDYVNDQGEAYPSIQTLCRKTSQDRKTAMSNIQKLIELGVLFDTGHRRGNTQQVIVYRVELVEGLGEMTGTKKKPVNSPKNGTVKGSRKRNSTENGTVPKTYIKSPKSGTVKESQKRYTEPPVLLTNRKPSVLPTPKTKAKSADAWEAYNNSYVARYGVEPIRGAKANSLLCKLIDCVGKEDAVQMASYYVNHNKAFYVQSGHKLELLVSDMQAIRTDMLRNTQTTSREAFNAEKTVGNMNAANAAIDVLRSRA